MPAAHGTSEPARGVDIDVKCRGFVTSHPWASSICASGCRFLTYVLVVLSL